MKHFIYKIPHKSRLRLHALQHESDQNPNLKSFYTTINQIEIFGNT